MIQYGKLLAVATGLAICATPGILRDSLQAAAPVFRPQARADGQVPVFQVDPLWPKPLPNHWILGSVTGVWVDAQDHIWLVHRGMDSLTARTEAGLATDPPTAETCCAPAPPVLEFDQAGTLLNSWGGPGQGYEWPRTPAGITVDAKGNVWIAGIAPRSGAVVGGAAQQTIPPQDAHVIKFTRAGKFVLQIGRAGKSEGGSSETTLDRPATVAVDPGSNEVYVADQGNHRVAVFDSETGAYKRRWGAYDEKGKPPAKEFGTMNGVRIGKDGLVYVCDRRNNRIQVFRKDGTFVKEAVIAKETLGEGSVWDIAFSIDPQQRFLYVADGSNQKVWVLRRDTLASVSSVGAGGRWPGHFYGVGNVAVDSKGNLYTGETYEGKRLQKFMFKGLGAAAGGKS